MLRKIDHVGIAVASVDAAAKTMADYFDIQPTDAEVIESQGVRVRMFSVGESMIELLEPTREESPIARFLKKRGEGIHHIAFGVQQLKERLDCLKGRGALLLQEEPIDGAHHKSIAFLHPKATHSVLIELCERKG